MITYFAILKKVSCGNKEEERKRKKKKKVEKIRPLEPNPIGHFIFL